MKVLITGGTGFVGAWTAKAAQDAGHQVRFLVRNAGRLATSAGKIGVDIGDHVLGDIADGESTAAALESAKGVIRSEVAKQLGMRIVPTLTFFPDALPESARALEDVLARAKAQDEAVAALRGDSYAGDEDPYVKPREADEE